MDGILKKKEMFLKEEYDKTRGRNGAGNQASKYFLPSGYLKLFIDSDGKAPDLHAPCSREQARIRFDLC